MLKVRASWVLSVSLSVLFAAQGSGEEVNVFSIADQIHAQNDCSDYNNEPCKQLFQTTCSWVGDSAATIANGLDRDIPPERIHKRILAEMVEIGEGSGGYIDVDLANSFIEPVWNYFATGQYDEEISGLSDNFSLGLGMVMGGEMTGSFEGGAVGEYMESVKSGRNEMLRSRWENTCLETAYQW